MTEYRHRGFTGDDRTAAGLDRPPSHPRPRPKGDVFRKQDHIEAAAQGFRAFMGLRPPRDPHPMADDLIRAGDFGFMDLATTCLEMNGRPLTSAADGFNDIMAALSTSDYPTIITETMRGLAEARTADPGLLADILAMTHPLRVKSYQAESYSVADLEDLPNPSPEQMNQYHVCTARITGESVRVLSLFAQILVSRQALTNDDRGFVSAAVSAFIAQAHRNELKMVSGLLESGTLADAGLLFHSDYSNTASGAVDATGLKAATTALRSQTTEGGVASNAAPGVIVVHPDDEVAALQLVQTLPEDRRLRVVTSAFLANTHWYLLAQPSAYPVVGRTLMEGASDTAVSFGAFEPASVLVEGEIRDYPGVALPATHSVGIVPLSRIGGIKVAK